MLSVVSPDYARQLLGAAWHHDEDFLTAEFFGLVRYAPPHVLAAVLERATILGSGAFQPPPGCDSGTWELELWPQEAEGIPDGRIRSLDQQGRARLDVLLEVKLRSGPSDGVGKEAQLIRYASVARRSSQLDDGRHACATVLLYLTLDPPDTKTLSQLDRVRGMGVQVLVMRWHDVADAVFELLPPPGSSWHILLNDLYGILRSRGIMASKDVPMLDAKLLPEIPKAFATVRAHSAQVLQMVEHVDATCRSAGFQFKYWQTSDYAELRTNRLPQATLGAAAPLAHSFFIWRNDTLPDENPAGSVWVVLEHCADGSLASASGDAPDEAGSYLAVFVARPEPAFEKEAFNLEWHNCLMKQFGCDSSNPRPLFPPRVRRGGMLEAFRVGLTELGSGDDFRRLVAERLDAAIRQVTDACAAR